MTAKNKYAFSMVIALISFLGFCVEDIWLSLTKGYIDNRNMIFPFLLGYGLAIAAIYLLFGTPDKMTFLGRELPIASARVKSVLYFLAVFFCICIGEILLGKTVELTCHFYWWDYSWIPMHITRYTSVPTSLGFAAMIYLFMDKIYLRIYRCFLSWDERFLRIAATVLMAVMAWDFLRSGILMLIHQSTQKRWIINTAGSALYRLFHSI